MQLRVKELREEKGWNQTVLGYHAGLSPSQISQIENGKRNPTLETLQGIATALEVGVGDLFPKVEAPPEQESRERRFINALAHVVEVAMERWQTYLDSLPEQPTPEERREVVKRLKETIVDATKLRKVLEENFDLVAPYADAINAGKPVPQPLRGDVIVLEHALFGIEAYLIPKAKEWASIDKEWSEWATNERIRLEDTAQKDV